MMPGGTDTVIDLAYDSLTAARRAVAYLRAQWPQAVVQTDEDEFAPGQDVPFRPGEYDPANANKLYDWFIFRDAAAVLAWDKDGSSDANEPLMIHVIAGPNQLTIVHGHNGGNAEMVEAIRKLLAAP